MEELLDITPGSLSIMGLMNDKEGKVQLLIDEALLREEYIGCHPCVNTSTLRIKTQDVIQTLIPAMKHFAKTVALTDEN
jgi:Ala-tRNA(Pro) deacylase